MPRGNMACRPIPNEEPQVSIPVNTDLECCICYHAYFTTTMDVDAEMPMQLSCGHIFGEKCISKWMSTKNTCPLCRCELFFLDSNLEDQDVWVGRPVSDTRNLGSTSVNSLSASSEPELPHEQVRISEVELLPARTSTAAHQCFATHAGPCSAHHQHTGQVPRSYARSGREPTHSRIFVACLQTGHVWNTSLTDHMDDSAMTVGDDIWMTLLDEDEYVKLQHLRETPLYEPYQQDEPPDSVFDRLLIDHTQWMRELEEESDFGAFDGLATSYNSCV